MSLQQLLSEITTAEEFELIKGRFDHESLDPCYRLFDSVKTKEVCSALLRHCVSMNHKLTIKDGFSYYLQTVQIDYLACFIGYVDINKMVIDFVFGIGSNGYMDLIAFLLDNGLDVNLCCEGYSTMLFGACYGKRVDLIRLLIEKGVDVNYHNSCDRSALYYAIRSGEVQIIDLLIIGGYRFTEQDDIKTALLNHTPSIIQRLVDMKAVFAPDCILFLIRNSMEKTGQSVKTCAEILLQAGYPKPDNYPFDD